MDLWVSRPSRGRHRPISWFSNGRLRRNTCRVCSLNLTSRGLTFAVFVWLFLPRGSFERFLFSRRNYHMFWMWVRANVWDRFFWFSWAWVLWDSSRVASRSPSRYRSLDLRPASTARGTARARRSRCEAEGRRSCWRSLRWSGPVISKLLT